MQRIIGGRISIVLGAMCWMAAVCQAQVPDMPKPTQEHELLSQFAGEWAFTAETAPAPGQESIKCEGKESSKMRGGFWLVSQSEASMQGMPVNNILTLGYDPTTKKYVGTFVCSMASTLWKYEGTMDESGQKLTLETEGPSPLDPAKTAKYREILELQSKDHKVFTSYMLGADGKWIKFVTMDYRRTK